MRRWLHWFLFRNEHYELVRIRKDLQDIDARYTAKVNSLWRTPHEDTTWRDKFVALDADYRTLERELNDARTGKTHEYWIL